MKPRSLSLGQAIQRALQLDFFSDLLFSERLPPGVKKAPARPITPTLAPVATPTAPPANQRKILLQDQVLEYTLQRSTRRSIGFLINQDGLRVTAPRWVSIAEIEQSIQEKQRWILTKLSERRERLARRVQVAMRWEDGATFLYLGKPMTLRIASAGRVSMRYDDVLHELHLALPQPHPEDKIKDRVKSWLQQQAKQIFSARMAVYAEMLGVRYQSMALSSATTRWGSCTSQGKIRLNWRLVHFSPELIDYVIAHELSHLHEMNHSPRFWAHVQSVFPDFELARRHLRQHATADLPVF